MYLQNGKSALVASRVFSVHLIPFGARTVVNTPKAICYLHSEFHRTTVKHQFREDRQFPNSELWYNPTQLHSRFSTSFHYCTDKPSEKRNLSHNDNKTDKNSVDKSRVLKCMIENHSDPRQVLDYVEKKSDVTSIRKLSQILELCWNLETIDYGQSLYDEIVKRHGPKIAMFPSNEFLIEKMFQIKEQKKKDVSQYTPEVIVQLLNKLGCIGLRPKPEQLRDIVMPSIFDGNEIDPRDLFNLYKDCSKKQSSVQSRVRTSNDVFMNITMQYFLNITTVDDFKRAAHFSYHLRYFSFSPKWWYKALAKAFLRTKDQNSYITILGCSSSFVGNEIQTKNMRQNDTNAMMEDVQLFSSLNEIVSDLSEHHPCQAPDDVLIPILKELCDCKIGVPPIVTEKLRTSLKSDRDNLNHVLDQLEYYYEKRKDIWNRKQQNEFKQRLKTLMKFSREKSDLYHILKDPKNSAEEIISLEEYDRELSSRGRRRRLPSNKLLLAYVKAGRLNDADMYIKKIVEQGSVMIYQDTSRAYIKACIENNDLYKACDFVEFLPALEKTTIYLSSLTELSIALAKCGDHEKVVEIFESLDNNVIHFGKQEIKHAKEILDFYATNGCDEIYKKVRQAFDRLNIRIRNIE